MPQEKTQNEKKMPVQPACMQTIESYGQVLHSQEARTSTAETKADESALEGPLEEAVLENSNQFYRWHSELEAARTLETEEKYKEYAGSLKAHIAGLDAQHTKVSSSFASVAFLGFFGSFDKAIIRDSVRMLV